MQPEKTAQQSVTYSRNHVFERSAVQDKRAILQAAIDRGMGQASYSQVRDEFEQRVSRGEFRAIERTDGRAAPLYTTAEMMRMERRSSVRCSAAISVVMTIQCWYRRSCESDRGSPS